jgi:hypothetical protein
MKCPRDLYQNTSTGVFTMDGADIAPEALRALMGVESLGEGENREWTK